MAEENTQVRHAVKLDSTGAFIQLELRCDYAMPPSGWREFGKVAAALEAFSLWWASDEEDSDIQPGIVDPPQYSPSPESVAFEYPPRLRG